MRPAFFRPWTLAIALLAVAPAVGAQVTPTPADRVEARSHFTAGVQAFQRQSWQSALEEFQSAYRLAPHPSVRINMANCYVELQRPVEAIFHFEQYLAETPANVETPQRTAVQAHLRELRQRISEVTLNVTPADARDVGITVDGTSAPVGRPIRTLPGRHTIEVRANGYATARQEFDGPAGGMQTLTIALTPDAPAVAPVPVVVPVATPAVTVTTAPPVTPTPTTTATPTGNTLEPGPRTAAMEVSPGNVVVPHEAPRRGPAPGYFWTAVGVTGAAAIACGVFGALALSANSDFDAIATQVQSGTGNPDRQAGLDAADRAERYALFSDIALGVTVVGAVASTLLFVKTDFHPRVEVAASPHQGGGSVILGGRF